MGGNRRLPPDLRRHRMSSAPFATGEGPALVDGRLAGPLSSKPSPLTSRLAPFAFSTVLLFSGAAATSNVDAPAIPVVRDIADEPSTSGVAVSLRRSPSSMQGQRSLSSAVRKLHDSSGLTWEQLARLFGVSRRAVHNWANGGRMTDFHAGLLSRLTRVIDQLPAADAASRRAYLLAPGEDGHSLYEHVRAQLAESVDVINEPSLALDQRLGVASDD